MKKFSNYHRKATFNILEEEPLDLLVIGGGITGAGIALDAVTRGLRTGLVEMNDFAAGTSSKSTKLVHGGLRYLKQLDIKIVAEVGKERAVVYENGPHVTTPEWMMLPFYKGGTFGPFTTNIALWLYDRLANVKKEEHRKMLSPKEAIQKEPLLSKKGLKGAGYYVEYKTDDARLTIEVVKKAVEMGAHAINYAKVVSFIYEEEKVIGVVLEDQISDKRYSVYAKKIINATGPWVDRVMDMDQSKHGKELILTKGAHLVFSSNVFPLQQAIYFNARDGRMIFAIPRNNKAYVGTTDTIYKENDLHPKVTIKDYHYLLDAVHYMFPSLKIQKEHVESSWAGLRPLIAEKGKDPGEISRKDEIFRSKTGLISIAGGKLTGYRKMAEEIIDTVVQQLKDAEGILYSSSETYHLPISGGDVGGSTGFKLFKTQKIAEGIALGLTEEEASNLVQQYGKNAEWILHILQENEQIALEEGIDPIVFAELMYALEYECIYKATDFFVRRTGALFFQKDWVELHKHNVIRYMAKMLEWSTEETKEYRLELDQLIYEASPDKNTQ